MYSCGRAPAAFTAWESGLRDGHAGRGGFPHEGDLRRGQGVGLVDEVAEGALQFQSLGGEGAGGGSSGRAPERGAWGVVSGNFLSRMCFASPTQVSESRSVTARSLLLGFSTAYFPRNQSSNVRWVCCRREVFSI